MRLLFDTHRFYTDRPSRRAAQTCLASVIAANPDPDRLASFVADIRREAQKPTIAPSNAFVLVEWCAILLRGFVNTPLWDTFGLDIVHTNAAALETCLQPTTRPSVAQSALVLTRRGLRAAFWHGEFRGKTIQDIVQALTAKGSQPAARNAAMLGVVAGVCSRNVQAREILATQKPSYFAFFVREFVGSRTAIPRHLVTSLRDFFSDFVTLDDLEKDVIPPVEKGLLRAPEVVLDILVNLLTLLPRDGMDLSSILGAHLLKPLLSNVKSSNPSIRESVLAVFTQAAVRTSDIKTIGHIVDEIAGPLKSGKLASADQRVLHANMLQVLSFSSADATKVATSLAPVAAKEGNEAALAAELSVLSQAVICLIRDDAEVPKSGVDAFVKGMGDKKFTARRLWILRCGDILLSMANGEKPLSAHASKFAEAITTPMLDNWAEAIKNPIAAAQSGLITGTYVLAALATPVLSRIESPAVQAKLKKADIVKESLSLDQKSAFLLNHRVYDRLSADDDYTWFLRSLQEVYPAISGATELTQTTWSQAFIYLVSAASIPPNVRKVSCEVIAKLYARDPGFMSIAIIGGLWQWVKSSDKNEKDSIAASAKFQNSYLHLVLRSITLSDEDLEQLGLQRSQHLIEQQMCALLILARKDLVPRCSWIDLCLKVGVDPEALVRKYEQELIDQLVEKTQFDQNVRRPRSRGPYLLHSGTNTGNSRAL